MNRKISFGLFFTAFFLLTSLLIGILIHIIPIGEYVAEQSQPPLPIDATLTDELGGCFSPYFNSINCRFKAYETNLSIDEVALLWKSADYPHTITKNIAKDGITSYRIEGCNTPAMIGTLYAAFYEDSWRSRLWGRSCAATIIVDVTEQIDRSGAKITFDLDWSECAKIIYVFRQKFDHAKPVNKNYPYCRF